jgi:NADH:ubiquinone oxidoreductase subunit F (NADH-binding)
LATDPTAPGIPVAPSLPRLLAGYRGHPVDLRTHLSVHGPLPALAPGVLVDGVRRAGLIGRGGARFPTAVKLQSVASGRGPRVVVVNGVEGEPVSAKDRCLLGRAPHLVLDGAVAAAGAVGAVRVIVAVRPGARGTVATAADERRRSRMDRVQPEIVATPERFLAGEESALVNFLSGGPLLPRLVPPRPYERGVDGRPTLVSNAETLAHLALIARHGPQWFRQVGTPAEPGSTLVTIGGAVRDPGVYEVARGVRVADALSRAGGATASVQALLVGGYAGTWVPAPAVWEAPLSEEGLAPAGGVLGAGLVIALPVEACGIAETARILRYLSDESAGQCGPCVNGLAAIAGGMEELAFGRPPRDTVDRLRKWAWQVSGRGACHHPDGAVRLVTSALKVFAGDLASHRRHQPCPYARRATVTAAPAAMITASGAGTRR